MAISYMPLLVQLTQRKMKKTDLELAGVCSRNTIAKFGRGDYVSLEVVDRICAYLDCRVEDVIEYVKEEPSTG